MSGELPATSNRLYKNDRDGPVTDMTEKAGLRYTIGARAFVSAAITMMDLKIFSVPSTARTSFTAITVTALLLI